MQPPTEGLDYPVTLALAYLFLCTYLAARLFVALKLPGAVGAIIVGFLFSFFIQNEVLSARKELQELSFFLVLLTAGFEITLPDLSRHVLLMGFLPASVEIFGIGFYACRYMGFTPVQGGVMGLTFCGLGDGLVIPKMKEFFTAYPGHPMPRLMFIWAPLEASFVLTLWGVASELAEPEGVRPTPVMITVLWNICVILTTLAGGALLGVAAGSFVMVRNRIAIGNRKVFTGTTVEAYLVIIAVALFAFGVGSTNHKGVAMLPLFQPELVVIVVGSAAGAVVSDDLLHSVEHVMGGVWVFGQLILFTMLGSKTDLSVFSYLPQVFPMMLCGLVFRFFGVLFGFILVRSGLKRPAKTFLADVFFLFLSTLPRASLQGVLSGQPSLKKFFHKDANGLDANKLIFIAGRLYVVLFSIAGSIMLDAFGFMALASTYGEAPKADQIESFCHSTRSRAARSAASIGPAEHSPGLPGAESRAVSTSVHDVDPLTQLDESVSVNSQANSYLSGMMGTRQASHSSRSGVFSRAASGSAILARGRAVDSGICMSDHMEPRAHTRG